MSPTKLLVVATATKVVGQMGIRSLRAARRSTEIDLQNDPDKR